MCCVKKMSMTILVLLVASLALMCMGIAQAQLSSPLKLKPELKIKRKTIDFSGQTIEWIIPFEAGGGSDEWAKFYLPLLSDALPGKPSIKINNMTGGGSTKGANYFAKHAQPDGLTILGTSGSTHFPYLFGDSRVEYDYEDWHVVLITPTSGVVSVAPATGVTDAADLKFSKTPLVYGSNGVTSLDLLPLLAFDMLDLDVEAIFGMRGRSESRKGLEIGDVTIDYQTTAAYIANVIPLVETQQAIPLMSWGVVNATGAIVRDPTSPDLPTFPEVYAMVHGEAPSGLRWEAWKTLFITGFSSQKKLFLPKDTPKEIIDAYTQAMRTIFAQPGFEQTAQQHLGLYQQTIGLEAKKMLAQSIDVDAQSIEWIKNWVKEKYQLTLK